MSELGEIVRSAQNAQRRKREEADRNDIIFRQSREIEELRHMLRMASSALSGYQDRDTLTVQLQAPDIETRQQAAKQLALRRGISAVLQDGKNPTLTNPDNRSPAVLATGPLLIGVDVFEKKSVPADPRSLRAWRSIDTFCVDHRSSDERHYLGQICRDQFEMGRGVFTRPIS